MTDNETIKALECCLSNGLTLENCPDCPYQQYRSECMDDMLADALALINRQKTEIEHLNKVVETTAECAFEARQTAMVWARAEAIEEFAERLRSRVQGVGVHNAIDCIEREMVGDGDG